MANVKKELLVYGFGSFLVKGISFLLIPLYASQFSAHDYGILTFCRMGATALSWFLGLHIFSGMWRYYYQLDETEQLKLVRSSFTFYILSSLILLIIVYLISILIPNIRNNYLSIIMLVASATMFADLATRSASIYRLKREPIKYLFFSIGQTLLQLSLIIFFVLTLNRGILSIFWGRFFAGIAVVLIFILVGNKDFFTFKIDKVLTKKMLKFSIPLIPGAISMWVLNSTDNFFIKHYYNLADVGIYAFSYKIAMLVQIVLVAPIKQAWNPYIFSNIHNLPLVRKRINQALILYFIIGIGMVLGLTLFTADILKLFAKPEYIEGTKIIYIVGYSYLIYGACALLAIAYHIAEKTKELPKYFTYAAALNVILNFLIVPRFGYVGAAWTTIISFILIFWLYIVNINKYFYLPLKWKVIILFNMGGLFIFLIFKFWHPSLLYKLLLFFLYFSSAIVYIKRIGISIIPGRGK